MKLRALLLSALLLTAAGCKKAQKPDTPAPEATAAGDNIQTKDMTFDPQGSDGGNISGLQTIRFDYDKSALTEEARNILQKNADWMRGRSDVNLQVEGHCDRHGSIEYNLALGERRAKAVSSYLANLGVDAKRLSTISYGKEKPLDSSETEAADAKNRRANFVVQPK
jgi:peptidoglycan-associated lipoprotein